MIIEKETHPEFRAGVNADIDTASEKLTDLSIPARKYVKVEAAAGNAGIVYVGHDASVSATNGWPLSAGELVEIPIDDPSKVWVIASAVNQSAKWLVA